MNEKEKMQPKVRFREFTGENAPDWEQRKLGEIAKDSIGGGTPKTEVVDYWDGNLPWIQSSDLLEHKLDTVEIKKKISYKGLENSAAKLVPANSIAIVTRVGVGKLAIIPFDYSTSQDILSLCYLKINKFFAAYLIYRVIQRQLKFIQGTSIKGITKSELLNFNLLLPESLSEQECIGNLLKKIDKLITLHQRKLEQLEQLKNTLLSKMFPKSGTNIPEIRFSGFTDAWKQRKLEEIIVKEIKGKAKSENISTNFANKGSLYLDTEYLNGGKPKYVSLPSDTDENDIIILWDGSQAGKLYKGVVGALGSTLKAYKIPEHTLFYYYQMLGSQEKIYNQYRTPNIPHVVKSFTSEFMIWDTSNDEKTLIIDIYSNLFNYIAIHQRKLDQLKNLKQTLLNKMFI